MKFKYVLLYKPFGILSQFTTKDMHPSLKSLGEFPGDLYPAGRLDADSEGLLFLTNDSWVAGRITEPRFNHPRTYLVQVEGVPSEAALQILREGVTIEGRRTKPAHAVLLDHDPELPPRIKAIRYRKHIPTTWLEITLREGRNRQVRKMTAAVGHPTLRLVRTRIGFLSLAGLSPGEKRELTSKEIRRLKDCLQQRSDRAIS